MRPGRPARHRPADPGAVIGALGHGLVMQCLVRGLVGADEGGADLNPRSAQFECGRNTAPVGNAARRDDRNRHGIHHLRQKREQPHLRVILGLEEHAPVPARFPALRDHRIDAPLFQPARLGHRGGGTQQLATGLLQGRDSLGARQTEMETHHRRRMQQQQLKMRRPEGLEPGFRHALGRRHPGLGVMRGQRVKKGLVLRPGDLGDLVTEKIQVHRPVRRLRQCLHVLFQPVERHCRTAMRAKPAAV